MLLPPLRNLEAYCSLFDPGFVAKKNCNQALSSVEIVLSETPLGVDSEAN